MAEDQSGFEQHRKPTRRDEFLAIMVIDAMDLALVSGQRLGVKITGKLAVVITKINERPCRAISAYLIHEKTTSH